MRTTAPGSTSPMRSCSSISCSLATRPLPLPGPPAPPAGLTTTRPVRPATWDAPGTTPVAARCASRPADHPASPLPPSDVPLPLHQLPVGRLPQLPLRRAAALFFGAAEVEVGLEVPVDGADRAVLLEDHQGGRQAIEEEAVVR